MYNKDTSSNWVDDKTFIYMFTLDNNNVTIINPKYENPLSIKNSMKHYQYMHGGVNVTDKDGSQISVDLVFRVVNTSIQYHVDTDKMVYKNHDNGLRADHLFEKNDVQLYHPNLLKLYRNIFLCNKYLNI